jgi:hypothetical protein
MSTFRTLSLVIVLGCFGAGAAEAGNGCDCGAEATCGCQSYCRPHGHHHLCKRKHCCCDSPAPREMPTQRYAPPPPVGPIMESVPLRMMPVMAAPVMYATQPVAYAEPRSRETTCETSTARVAQLEERLTALQTRVNVLQDTMTTQTDILYAIKAKLDKLDAAAK